MAWQKRGRKKIRPLTTIYSPQSPSAHETARKYVFTCALICLSQLKEDISLVIIKPNIKYTIDLTKPLKSSQREENKNTWNNSYLHQFIIQDTTQPVPSVKKNNSEVNPMEKNNITVFISSNTTFEKVTQANRDFFLIVVRCLCGPITTHITTFVCWMSSSHLLVPRRRSQEASTFKCDLKLF